MTAWFETSPRSFAFEEPRSAVEQQVNLVSENLGATDCQSGRAGTWRDLPSRTMASFQRANTSYQPIAKRPRPDLQGVSLDQGLAVGQVINGKLWILRPPERHGPFRPPGERSGPRPGQPMGRRSPPSPSQRQQAAGAVGSLRTRRCPACSHRGTGRSPGEWDNAPRARWRFAAHPARLRPP